MFQCLRIHFVAIGPWRPESSSDYGLVVELHMHTNVYAVYAGGYSLSVPCQMAMVNTT